MPVDPRPRPLAPTVLALLLVLASVRPAGAQPARRCEIGRRVVSVDFAGSPKFPDDTLAATIVTKGAGWKFRLFRFGQAPCADSVEVRRDALRLAILHRQAGWFTAFVTPRFVPDRRGVRLLFDITPGPAAILDTIRVSGLPPVPEGRRAFDETLRAMQGRIFDRGRLANTIEETLARMRNVGYARVARPESRITIDTAAATVSLDLTFAPGARLSLGEVHVGVQGIGNEPPKADSGDVMRLIGIRPGQQYRADAILDAQRELYRSEAFRLVLIDTAPPRVGSPDSVIDLQVSVAEAKTRYGRVGVGWATQDCMRAQGRVADRSFLGIGRRAELNVRASKIGVGAPADFAPALCANSVRRDTFSLRLNYFVGLSLSDAVLFNLPLAPVFTVYSERRSEPLAYLRETDIGTLLELSRQFSRRTSGTAGVQYENGRTITNPVISCSRFAQCRPEEYEVSLFGRGVGILSTSVTHDRTTTVVDPDRGQRLRAELRLGQTVTERDPTLQFARATGEASTYGRLAGGRIALRLQLAHVFAPGAQLIDGSPLLPQQERLFAGGQNSVRGFRQNLLGPLVYVVTEVDTVSRDGGGRVVQVSPRARVREVPRGGTALLVANFELRRTVRSISDQLQAAAFVDVGNVWETQSGGFRSADLRATPGVGLRLGTPLGPFRVDVGYNPYPPRAGRALFLTSDAQTRGTIRCASPGNNMFIDRETPGGTFDCPETYQPPRGRLLSRLAFHFGLGQAF